MNAFKIEGFWVKGNLHTHSSNSDGRLTPEEVAEFYALNGYGFLSITDHETLTKASSDKLTLIPGVETEVGRGCLGHSYHLVVIGVEDWESVQRLKGSISELLDFVSESRGLAFIAHPYWSSLTLSDLTKLEDCMGIEIYNTGCDVECAKGFSTVHWDGMLAHGRLAYGLAVDDAHRYTTPPIDAVGGWVYVKVRERSMDGILDSLRRGLFYSSMGPVVEDFSYRHGFIEACFTPVQRIDVVSENGRGFSLSLSTYERFKSMVKTGELGKLMEGLEVDLNVKRGVEEAYVNVKGLKVSLRRQADGLTYLSLENYTPSKYFRIELTDSQGRKAWINPVIL